MIRPPDHPIAPESILRALNAVQPTPGLEDRLLASLAAHTTPAPNPTRWWLFAPLAASLLIAAILFTHPHTAPRAPFSSAPAAPGAPFSSAPAAPGAPFSSAPAAPGAPFSSAPAAPGAPSFDSFTVEGWGAFPVPTSTSSSIATPTLPAYAPAAPHRRQLHSSPTPPPASELALNHPAPPEPLTEQERLLLRLAHHPDPDAVAMLDPQARAEQAALEKSDFEKFFAPPPPPKQALPDSNPTIPSQSTKEHDHAALPPIRQPLPLPVLASHRQPTRRAVSRQAV